MDFAIQKTFSSEEIRRIRKRLNLKQKDFAKFMNVSVKTIEHWEKMGGEIKGAGAALLNILRERSWLLEELEIPEKKMPLRLKYYNENRLCTIIDVDDRQQQVRIKNYVTDPLFRAFGRNEHPDYENMMLYMNGMMDIVLGKPMCIVHGMLLIM